MAPLRAVTYDAFQKVEGRRRSFHEEKRSRRLRRLSPHMLAFAEGEPAAQLTLSDVDDPIVRPVLCKAVHDTTEWQYLMRFQSVLLGIGSALPQS